MEKRWPDQVLEARRKRLATELELAPKSSKRLGRILDGYALAPAFRGVVWLVTSDALRERLQRLGEERGLVHRRRMVVKAAPTPPGW